MPTRFAGLVLLGAAMVVLAPVSAPVLAQSPAKPILATLRQGHPRIYLDAKTIARVRSACVSDASASRWHADLRRAADRMLSEPPVQHVLIGPRLLDKSRRALDRITTLSLMYQLDGGRRYAERARIELLAVSAFPDWNPSHFLDTAEMSHAVGVGYDWLYDYLSPADRAVIRGALVRMGLNLYRDSAGWAKANHNWNQVCNGGITIGALAVADEEPQLAERLLRLTTVNVRRALASYAPDGGWAEGPGYWDYATTYTADMIAALQSALGTDLGLCASPGLADTGLFRIHFTGPTGLTFNYADAGDHIGMCPELLWLDRQYRRPLYAWAEHAVNGTAKPLDLVWYQPAQKGPAATGVPLGAWYRGINVAFFRSRWEDPKAVFVGVKGGDNRANHRHLDLGTFVMDALGQRWVIDLGSDNYNLPKYFGTPPLYYRQRTVGHNTLLIDGADQSLTARSPITTFALTKDGGLAVLDLSSAYAGQARSVRRGIRMLSRAAVLVQDEYSLPAEADVVWQMHTRAKTRAVPHGVELTQHGETLRLQVLEPADARVEVVPARPSEMENQNAGVLKILVRSGTPRAAGRIAVLLNPGVSGGPTGLPVVPLQAWTAKGVR